MNYYNLRVEHKRDLKKPFYVNILETYLSNNFSIPEIKSKAIVKKALNTSNSPIEFLRQIQNSLN